MLLSEADERILSLIGRLHYLTNEQIRRRYYGRSLSYVQKRTRELCQRDLLIAIKRSPYGHGSLPTVFTLSTRGRNLLGIGGRTRPAEETDNYSLFLRHTLDVNDVLIAFELLSEQSERVELVRMIHERDIAKLQIPAKPDAVIFFYLHGKAEGWLLELDRGTEDQRRVREKVKALIDLIRDEAAYTRAFTNRTFTRVLYVAPDDRRAGALSEWIGAELANQPALRERFTIAPFDHATSPESIARNL